MVKFRADAVQIDSQAATVGGYRLLSNQPATNGDSVILLPGMPVIVVSENTIVRASAASTGLSAVDGIVFVGAGPTLACMFRSSGRINLDPLQWDDITGESGGLWPGAFYFLGLVPGTLTTAPPFAPGVGQSACVVGKAFSPGSLIVEIGSPILL